MKEKFYIIAERQNPQLGTYLSNAFVGTKRVNKRSISTSYEYLGSKRTMKFELSADNASKAHCDLGGDGCVYGSMAYYGFDSLEDAVAYLDKRWSKHYNYDRCRKALAA